MKTTATNVLMLCLIAATPLACNLAAAADVPPPDQVIVEGKRGDLVKAAKEVQLLEQRFFQRYNELNTRKNYAVRCYNEAPTGSRFKQKYCKPVFETNAEAAEAREFMTAIGRGASAGSTSGGGTASSGVMGVGGMSAGMAGAAGPNIGDLSGPGPAAGAANGATSSGAQYASAAGIAPTLSGGGTLAAFVDIDTERPAFQKNVVEVASKSPELIKLLQEHDEARQRYEAIYRQMHGAEPEKTEPPTAAPSAH